jgi:carbonic anhydrase/acetyltransferase-like protein (isoleucine patch superfamily)
MDNARIGSQCIVGALCLVPSEMKVPDRKVVAGNPARIIKDVSDSMAAWKTAGTRLYQALPEQLRQTLRPCEPLRQIPRDRPRQEQSYLSWKESQSGK